MEIEYINLAHNARLGIGDTRDIEIVGADISKESWGFTVVFVCYLADRSGIQPRGRFDDHFRRALCRCIVYLGKVSDHYDRFTLMYSQIVVVLACSLIGLFSYETIKFEYATGLIVSRCSITLLATLLTTRDKVSGGYGCPHPAAIIFTTEPVIAAICASLREG